MPASRDEKEAAEGYVRLAAELGYSLSAEEILAASREMVKAQAQKTDAALDKVSLEETDLDHVAGGNAQHVACEDTYNDGEWCWLNDSCIVVFSWYEDDTEEMEFDENDILHGFHITDPDIIDDLPDDIRIIATPKKNPLEDLLGDF